MGVTSFNWWVWPVPDLYFQKLEPMVVDIVVTLVSFCVKTVEFAKKSDGIKMYSSLCV